MSVKLTRSELPLATGAHHAAYRCRNAEETRAFYEDLLGFPMVQALDINEHPTTGDPLHYMHIFFDIGGQKNADPNYLAFFEVAEEGDIAPPFEFKHQWGLDLHFAMGVVDHDALAKWRQLLIDRGLEVEGPIDHEIFSSIYFHDPNGYRLEFTAQNSSQAKLFLKESTHSHKILQDWVERKNITSTAAE